MAAQNTRDARRRLTAARIERAALRQAVENGSAAVTVETICSEALISPRTFYNYFPTRDAVLAGQEWTVPAEVADRFAADDAGDLLSRLVRLFVDAGPHSVLDHEVADLRKRLFEREPEWAEQAMAGFTQCVDDVAGLVLTQLQTDGRSTEAEPDLPEIARMTVMITGSVLHESLLAPEAGSDSAADAERLTGLARRAIAGLTR